MCPPQRQSRSPRPEARGRARNGEIIGRRVRDVRPGARACPAERRDAVVARGAGRQAGVGVPRRPQSRIGHKIPPPAGSRARPLDPVTGHRGRASGRWRRPVQLDGRYPSGLGRQSPGRVRHVQLGDGAFDARGGPRGEGVDRRDPVVVVPCSARGPCPGRWCACCPCWPQDPSIRRLAFACSTTRSDTR